MTEKSSAADWPKGFPAAFRIPGSTYRLQLNHQFTFTDAAKLVEYLTRLGITDCYASPILTARPGSLHGYDVCNCGELNPEIGSPDDFERWSRALRGAGMGLLLDIVPNHMGADPRNPWWRDVLQRGKASVFARWFDIDWERAKQGVRGKVVLAILEDRYWRVLKSGRLQVIVDPDGFALAYHQIRLPLSRESQAWLNHELIRLERSAVNLRRLLAPLEGPRSGASKLLAKPEAIQAIQEVLADFNGTPGEGDSFDLLHELLQRQHYRLTYWRNASEELNYRRFFDISDLVALRMELPEVFAATHELVTRLIREGKVTGLRVDHPDGLWDPGQYFERLQRSAFCGDHPPTQGEEGHKLEPGRPPLYVVAEKILSGQEALPSDWLVSGTTGYDFLNLLNGVFSNGSNRAALDETYAEFIGHGANFEQIVYESKLMILDHSMGGELTALARLLHSIATRTRYGVDFTASELHRALAGLIAAFPVYRTYVTEQSRTTTPEEQTRIQEAVQKATMANKAISSDVFGFIESLLLLQPPNDLDETAWSDSRQFVMKFQQLTGPVMAKGLEDTTFYNFNRLITLNEVGGAPERFGTSLGVFHQQNQWRAEHWPHTLLATATHDTKRGEDLRARLNVLSEMPEEWREAALKWRRLNAEKKTVLNGREAPDPNDEYFLYQTLVGSWTSEAAEGADSEIYRRRISEYMVKAIREAKAHTSWTDPNKAYETAMDRFVRRVLTHSDSELFLDDFMLFQRKIAFFALFNSLAQLVLKMTVPGIPDFYQGTELWDYSLVDPDNRRPVDYEKRKVLLAELETKFNLPEPDLPSLLRSLLKNYHTGQIKLYLIWRILDLRRRRRALFERGAYVPIVATGAKKEHICAFARTSPETTAITIVPRLVLGLTKGAQRGALEADVWQDTSLSIPAANRTVHYRNVLTEQMIIVEPDGRALAIPEMLGLLPVAVLEQIE